VSGTGPAPFSVEVSDEDGRVVVVVRGELDLATADQLEDALLPPCRAGRPTVLDVRGLDFMDSSGIRVVIAAHHAAQQEGGRLTLVRGGPRSAAGRVLEISGLDDVLEIVDEP
jgi:anti-anti-sigma factor